MKIIYDINNIQISPAHTVLTIGNFDGVHLGHQSLLKLVVNRAKETGGTGIVFTFEPHPRKVLAPDKCPLFLSDFKQKMEYIEETGIDIVVCAEFTGVFAAQDSSEFVKNILVDKIQAKEIIVGHDFSFGRGRKGNIEKFQEMGTKYGFEVKVLEPAQTDDKIISSSLIRDLINKGQINKVARYLGRFYCIQGKVVGGCKKGSAIGFPTANIDVQGKLVPHTGVYAVKAVALEKTFFGVANVGYNPTFKRNRLSVEVHIFDFSGDIYGDILSVSFISKIRDEADFESSEKLKSQIQKDIATAKKIIKKEFP